MASYMYEVEQNGDGVKVWRHYGGVKKLLFTGSAQDAVACLNVFASCDLGLVAGMDISSDDIKRTMQEFQNKSGALIPVSALGFMMGLNIEKATDAQRLVDLCFEIALTIDRTGLKTDEEKAEWIAKQLRDNGFDTIPIASFSTRKMEVMMWCEGCGERQVVCFEDIQRSAINGVPTGDITCSVCHLVLAVVTTSQPGKFVFLTMEDEMSLDVYLELDSCRPVSQCETIWIRENGSNQRITRQEWNTRYPDREPITLSVQSSEVYTANITHNLGAMAREAGLYECVWRPDKNGIATADQLITPLRTGLSLLKDDPARFQLLNPENGWGDYDGLVAFVEQYLKACEAFPSAKVSVSR